ncbi:MAG: MarR family transcriptional regulator [Thaumarchaeota archaeon]|nr:MarR family transcriptional regulator [Nitrososphaerota archaeon]
MSQVSSSDSTELWRSVTDAWKKLYRASERNLSKLGLSIPELRVLKLLHNSTPVTMAGLSKELMLTQAAMTGLVDRLEEEGLADRVRSKEDRRIVRIALTTKGERVFREAEKIHRQFVEKVLESVEDEEILELSSVLNKLAKASEQLLS